MIGKLYLKDGYETYRKNFEFEIRIFQMRVSSFIKLFLKKKRILRWIIYMIQKA